MSLKELQKKVRRRMSVEAKQELIAELRAEILKICPFYYDPAGDAKVIREIAERNETIMKKVKENKKEHLIADRGFPDYPVNDLSKIDEKYLSKKELLENLGCMIMQELFTHPFRFLRLRMLNAREVWRRENKKAKEQGKSLPYPDKNPGPETEEERLERCFGIVSDQNRKF